MNYANKLCTAVLPVLLSGHVFAKPKLKIKSKTKPKIKPKPATKYTIEANKNVFESLAFNDVTDF